MRRAGADLAHLAERVRACFSWRRRRVASASRGPGVPLCGDRSGELFAAKLRWSGLQRDSVFVSNVVHCKPLDARGRNRAPCAVPASPPLRSTIRRVCFGAAAAVRSTNAIGRRSARRWPGWSGKVAAPADRRRVRRGRRGGDGQTRTGVMRMWRMISRRPARRRATALLGNPWVLSAVGLAAASYVGVRFWRRT